MHLYYYSLSKKKFVQFFPSNGKGVGEIMLVNRFRNTEQGILILPLLIWGAIAAGAGVAAVGAKDWIVSEGGKLIGDALVGLASLLFDAAGFFLAMMAYVLDYAINLTINSALYNGLDVINIGWTTMRDFANMFFIFALLYVAIKTILGLAGGSTKRWVANLIIAALLINFSLFLTKVVIDAGNVLARGFWEQMTVTIQGPNGPVTGPTASMHFMQGLKLQSSLDTVVGGGMQVSPDATKKIMVYLGGALTMLIAGYVFLAGAILMTIRSVKLILLMILSPIAFLGFALPVGGGFSAKWLSTLIGSTFVAPAFLGMLYLDSLIINGLDLNRMTNANGAKLSGALIGDPGSFAIIYNYLVVIILLLASLTIASQVGNGMDSQVGKFAKQGLGRGAGYAFAGSAMAGRQYLGKAGKMAMKDEKWVKEQNRLVTKAGMKDATIADKLRATRANALLATAKGASYATFDARNSGMVNKGLALGGISAGAGTKKSYVTGGEVGSSITGRYRGTDKEKELIETAKSRYEDPAAQKSYLTRKGVELDEKRNKDVKKELDRGIAVEGEKANVKALTKEYKKAQEKRESKEYTDAQLKAEGDRIAELLKGPLSKLSGKESTELLTEEQLRMAPVIANLQAKDLASLTLKAQELAPETIAAINAGIGRNGGSASAVNYMKNQSKVGGPLSYDAKGDLTTLTQEYNAKKKEMGEGSADFKKYAVEQKIEIEKALGMLGGKDEMKSLSDAVKTHEVVQELTNKVATMQAADAQAAAAARSAPQSKVLKMTDTPTA